MKKRIYLNMCALACVMLLLSSLFIVYLLWDYSKGQLKRQMENEIQDIILAMNLFDEKQTEKYLEKITQNNNSRITIVNNEGKVMIDTQMDAASMKNHQDRPEIKGAFQKGSFFIVRYSHTMKSHFYYYAIKVDDQHVLRLAYESKNRFLVWENIVYIMLLAFVLMMSLSIVMAWKMSNTIIEPINDIDIHNPEIDFRYKEFNPLLLRISKYNEERKKNEKLRREFSANVSHELKTPITSILGYADLLRNSMVKKQDIVLFSEKIYKESERLINLVNDIIKLSRLDEKRVGIDKEVIYLDEMAGHVKESLLPVIDKYKVHFYIDMQQVKILAVEIMMEELLYNLCENAIKYNKVGGDVYLRISQENDVVIVQVEDTGIGIPKEFQHRIFERFYRVDKSHSKQIGGTGLGLAIVKHVVEYHEGDININSEVDVGTKITVRMQGAQ